MSVSLGQEAGGIFCPCLSPVADELVVCVSVDDNSVDTFICPSLCISS